MGLTCTPTGHVRLPMFMLWLAYPTPQSILFLFIFVKVASHERGRGGILNLKEGGKDERRNEIKNKEDRCFVYL